MAQIVTDKRQETRDKRQETRDKRQETRVTICGVTWLIYMWDMSHIYVWHDSCICVTRLSCTHTRWMCVPETYRPPPRTHTHTCVHTHVCTHTPLQGLYTHTCTHTHHFKGDMPIGHQQWISKGIDTQHKSRLQRLQFCVCAGVFFAFFCARFCASRSCCCGKWVGGSVCAWNMACVSAWVREKVSEWVRKGERASVCTHTSVFYYVCACVWITTKDEQGACHVTHVCVCVCAHTCEYSAPMQAENLIHIRASHSNTVHHTPTQCITLQHSATQMRAVTSSCFECSHIYDWVMSHRGLSHVTQRPEACHTETWVWATFMDVWRSHVTHVKVWLCHVTRVKVRPSHATHVNVWLSHVTHTC